VGWLGAIARVGTTAAVGNARGNLKADELEREQLKEMLALEARKRAEAREQERIELAKQSRVDDNLYRKQEQEGRGKDRAEAGLDRDEDRAMRERQFQENIRVREQEAAERREDRRLARELAAAGKAETRTSAPAREARERYLERVAMSAVEATGGDLKRAAARLVQDAATKDVFSEGMTMRHLEAAAAERQRAAAKGGRLTGSPRAPATGPAEPPSVDDLPPLSPTDRRRAQEDTGFREWLVDKGYKL